MKARNPFVFALALTILVSFVMFTNSNGHTDHWASDLYAQTNPIPSQIPVFGAAVIASSATAAGLAAPATGLRNYLTQAQCVNVSASTVVAGGIIDGNGSTPKLWISCPAAGANSPPIKFDPPIRLTAAAQTTMATGTNVQQVFMWLQGYTAR